MNVRDLGRLAYADALAVQCRCRDEVLSGGPEVLLLVEHPPVLTVGRSGGDDDLGLSIAGWAERGVEVVVADRGGRVTWHGPGQVVVYPIVDLRRRGRDVRAYVQALEDAGAAAVGRFGAPGRPGRDPVGVFVGPAKIASIGVSVSRWITQHGISLNVENDLGVYGLFTPCGLIGVPVTRLSDVAPVAVSLDDARGALAEELAARLAP
ncbi:MAG: lipoyl(octanoyl) transferase LipB [Deltaproteobacteria bacterium]|nr:lipoyl(octanoyl) transferase LipB [Deltaproteobacteria bacterium]